MTDLIFWTLTRVNQPRDHSDCITLDGLDIRVMVYAPIEILARSSRPAKARRRKQKESFAENCQGLCTSFKVRVKHHAFANDIE